MTQISTAGQASHQVSSGQLLIAAVPIGNPGDASQRLRDALATAQIIACEDTRKLKRLLADLEVPTLARFESYHDAVEKSKARKLLDSLRDGASILLVTDAGTPLVSDPGYELVRLAIAEQLPVGVIPGPNAALAALTVSGLPPDRFIFEGFLPKKSGARKARLSELAAEPQTLIFYDPARQIGRTLEEMADLFGGDRRACVARELTKTHEEVLRGTLAELIEALAGRALKGEVTLVVEGLTRKVQRSKKKPRI
jgi:16S rRNA (cytidine1402-2'-O)-methyltransferase